MFSERLDFLMRVTDTGNSALARAIAFDPSYISKLRSGKRKLPRNDGFFERAVPYFARNLTGDYRRKAISDAVLGGRALPEDRAQLEALLGVWLRGEDRDEDDSVRRLLRDASGLARDALADTRREIPAQPRPDTAPEPTPVLVFYGNEGKRRGVELFLSRLCASRRACTLLLYSDEDMSWLYEDADFTRRWGLLLKELLSNGGTIHTIHTLGRNATELMAAVQGWLPLYLTGRIESWYCPRLRDGVFRRSLFVARGQAALISASVMTGTGDMPNLLFEDAAAVAGFEAEFRNYLALCRPLMRVCRGGEDAGTLRSELSRIDAGRGALFIAQALPSFATMPPEVLTAMAGERAEELEPLRAGVERALLARLDSGAQVAELLHLPPPDLAEAPSLPVWELLGLPRLACGAEQLAEHLRAVLRLMARYGNYRAVVTDRIEPELMVLASEDAGALLLCPLPAVFSMEEQNICAALLEYLRRIVEDKKRKDDAAALEDYIRALRREG